MAPAFQTFLHLMYDREIFDEAVILNWFKFPSQDDSSVNESHEKIREQVWWRVYRRIDGQSPRTLLGLHFTLCPSELHGEAE